MMNKQTGNMYEWVSHTWNPIKGKCPHDCNYCMPGETKILMSDFTVSRIDEVKPGDKIWGLVTHETIANRINPKFEIAEVLNVSQRTAMTIKIVTEDGELECTPEHPLMGSTAIRNCTDYKAAKAFAPYETLKYIGMPSKATDLLLKGSKHSEIKSISTGRRVEVFNLETSSKNFIANGFVVHNCYMKVFKVGELRFDAKCMHDYLGEGNTIFVGSSTDMFADSVPVPWITETLKKCRESENTYLFQSKNPRRMFAFLGDFPEKSIFGTTIETNYNHIARKYSCAPSIYDRVRWIRLLPRRMVSIEPILKFKLESMVKLIKRINPEFVSIGADSQRCKLMEPTPTEIKALVEALRSQTKVKVKDNLKRVYGP